MSSAAVQPDPVSDPRVLHAEARLARLRESGEITLSVMRALGRRTIEALETPSATEPAAEPAVERTDAAEDASRTPPPLATRGDPVERLAKLARALTLTTNLEARLEDALVAYLAGEPARLEAAHAWAFHPANPGRDDPFAPLKTGRKARVRDLVTDVIDREIGDPEDADILIDALEERLLCDEAYDDIEDLPLRDIVERLCADLELKPDWKRWSGDGWKPNPPFTRPICSLFAEPSRRPILDDTADPDPRE